MKKYRHEKREKKKRLKFEFGNIKDVKT